MPPERFSPDDPREWINRAKSNLARAREKPQISEVYLEDFCFDAQQAAEKALKAFLIYRGVRFPYVHDLAELLGLVEQTGQAIPETVRGAARLTRYAIATQYPGLFEPVTWQEYEEAVVIAEAVVRWAQDIVRV
jgi:HEPN domain-containing protein